MLDFLKKLFDTDFMPLGQCFLWQPEVLWLHAISDTIITLAYYSIPLVLLYFVRRQRGMPFNRMVVMFGLFVFACGTTHLLEVWNLWVPAYRFAGVVKLATAAVSLVTAVAFVPLAPRALGLPRIEEANRKLRHTAAALKRSNTALRQFAYIASHDLQEPLRMVASYVQLLKSRYSGRLDSDADEFIQFAVDGAVRMQRLIDDLLAYSRLTTDAAPFADTDADSVFADTLISLHVAIQESGAVITNQALPVVQADATQLGMVFQNLVANAVKFRGPEPPRVHVAVEKGDREWVFSVADNGIGIDPRHAEQVFLLFKRPHGRDYPGSGIGLAVCKTIVERHGGRIWFDSRPGHGTVFYFSLPFLPSDQPAQEDEDLDEAV